nr:Fic family protein [Mesorhizobium sp. ES1-4]
MAFMEYFQKRFAMVERQASLRIIAIASAHHRLNYIHPFPDGNGRVSRLMSHAMALKAGIGGNGLWSISRGLARGLKDRGEYKRTMDHADSPRQGDRDGRANLLESALKDFVEWFLTIGLATAPWCKISSTTNARLIWWRRYCGTVGCPVARPISC